MRSNCPLIDYHRDGATRHPGSNGHRQGFGRLTRTIRKIRAIHSGGPEITPTCNSDQSSGAIDPIDRLKFSRQEQDNRPQSTVGLIVEVSWFPTWQFGRLFIQSHRLLGLIEKHGLYYIRYGIVHLISTSQFFMRP